MPRSLPDAAVIAFSVILCVEAQNGGGKSVVQSHKEIDQLIGGAEAVLCRGARYHDAVFRYIKADDRSLHDDDADSQDRKLQSKRQPLPQVR